MKKFLLIAFATVLSHTLFSQAAEVSRDMNGSKVLKGFMSKQDLANDTAFGWFAENQKGYIPYPAALQTLKNSKDSVRFLVFAGTWCSDTQSILPKFYSLSEAAGVSQGHITLLGVDRAKKTIQHLSEAFHIENVPTIIVLKDGKEIGRVVEYGKTGMFDKELGEIIASPVK